MHIDFVALSLDPLARNGGAWRYAYAPWYAKRRFPALPIAAAIMACLMLHSLPAIAAVGGAARSASHPIPAVTKAPDPGARPVFYQPPPAPLGLAASGDGWSVFSRGVNRINASASVGAETWLATDMGVKVLDRAHKTVTHYTRLDGLPDDRVLAISAAADGAWAIVATRHGEAFGAAVCELKRGSGKWRVLRESPRPIVPALPPNSGANASYLPGGPLENALVSACPEKLCIALSPIRREDHSFAYCFDRRLNVWDEIPALPAAIADRSTLSITWTDVDRDGIWLATTAGLLRYQLREKTWRRYLADRMVYAAAKAEDGTLWLADYLSIAQPVDRNPRAAVDNAPSGHWYATHVLPKTGATTDFPAPDTGIRQSAYGGRIAMMVSGISVIGRSVWLTPAALHPYGNPAPFFRLNTQDGTWHSFPIQSPADVDNIPDAALAQPVLPRSALQTAYYPWRLTEWVCRDASEPPQAATAGNPQLNKDSDGTQWSTDGRTLLQTDPRGAALRRFGLNQLGIPVTPQISTVTVLKGVLYAATNADLQAFDIAGGSWRRVRIPRSNWSNPNDERLIPEGDKLLIGTPSMALRYDPSSQLFGVEATTQNGGFRLLGRIGGIVWLRGPDNLLCKADPQTGEPENVDIAALPAELAGHYEAAMPFGAAGGAIWFRLHDKQAPEKGMFAGYDPIAGTWTRGHPVPTAYPSPPNCFSIGKRVYIPTVEEGASVCCCDMETSQWTVAAPKLPNGHGLQTLTVVSADDNAIWLLDARNRGLMCYHRKTAAWDTFEFPAGVWTPQNGNEAVLSGGTIYLATSLGVWTFDVGNHRWTQLPGFPGREIYLNGITTDRTSVWSIARPSNGNQAFAVRLDKVTRRWSMWGEKEGFPEKAYPANIVSDGSSAWTLASNVCFRFDTAANRWDNVSARLARPLSDQPEAPITIRPDLSSTPYLEIGDIAPDGDSVWLLPRRLVNERDNSAPKPLLVQFDRRTGRYERLAPATGPAVVGSSMQVESDAVWVPASDGVYRFSKASRTWRKIDPPASASLWGHTLTLRAVQKERTYTFYGVDSAVEWKE